MTEKTKNFLKKIKSSGHWNDNYDYSLVDYKSNKDKVIIVKKNFNTKHLVLAQSLLKKLDCQINTAINKSKYFVENLKQRNKLNENYDYSEINYKSANDKLIIINKTTNTRHLITPRQLYSNGNLDINNAINKRKFAISEFKNIHGDRYDYSRFKYLKSTTKSIIVCIKHGEFKQSASSHRQGIGCPKCGIEKASKGSKKSWDLILKKIKKIHKNKYDFSKSIYKGIKTNILVINKEFNTEHLITPRSLYGKGSELGIRNAKNKNKYFIKKSNIIHDYKYDYSLVNYKTSKDKLTILCQQHGEFEQSASQHWAGAGCPKCGGGVMHDTKYIINLFKKKHGDKYDYSLVKYYGAKSYIKIICPKHGEFSQRAGNHTDGRGCPTCGSGWNAERIANFINDIRNEDVLKMDDVELNMLISQGKLPKEFEELVFKLDGTGENSLKTLKEKLGIEDELELSSKKIEQIEKEIGNILSEDNNEVNNSLNTNLSNSPSIEDIESQNESIKNRKLPSISSSDILVLDKELINNCDDEAVEFFIQYKLRKVWNEVINDKRSADEIKSLNGGKNSSRLRDLFIDEYNKVIKYTPPAGYSFIKKGKIAPPNMMQKLTVNRIREYKRYGNWSGTGAGKTLSFIIASREVNARLTVVVCLNSTITQLGEDILEVYPDSIIHEYKKGEIYDRNKHNFLLLNYEKFQQGYSEEMLQELNKNNTIDFIVIDEVHNAKQRDKDESKRRGALMRLIGRSVETNPNFHLLGMSATPVINNLIEAKSLLQLISGKEYDDINTRGTISNALKVFSQLLLNGIRYIPKYNIVLNEITGENNPKLLINGESLTEKLKENNSKDYLGLEKILLELKLEYTKPFIKPKTIIYTYFTDNNRIPKRIGKFIKSLGLSYDYYIGEQNTAEREESKENFVKGNVDILIASRTIGTGVDGLQDVCNRMILLTLPWTDSEYTQLKGRIYRQGSEFGEVDIVIPQVYIDLENIKWSWDKQRLQLIRDKRTLADAAVDGIIPSKHLPTRTKLCSDSLKALKDWQKRVSEGNISITNRREIELPLRPEIIEYLRPSLGDFSKLNQTWSVSRSNNTFERLKKDKSEWEYYHTLYRQKRKDWDEIPYIEIAKKINKREDWIVADMGCGENLLAKEIPNKVHGFDYVACEEGVVACDISNVPLKDNSVDVVVFSLSLMGSNYIDYVKEGYRILKPFGFMFICEPYKKMEGKIENYKLKLEETGFNVTSTKTSSKKFVYVDCMK